MSRVDHVRHHGKRKDEADCSLKKQLRMEWILMYGGVRVLEGRGRRLGLADNEEQEEAILPAPTSVYFASVYSAQ